MAETEKTAQPQKSNKGLLLVVIVVMVLGFGGMGAFIMFGNKGQEAPAETQPKKKSNESANGPIVDLDGFVVNLQNTEEVRYLKVKVSVEVSSEEELEKFNKLLAVVKNEILLNLADIDIERTRSAKGKRVLEKKLADALNKRLGGDIVNAVYFTEFVTQ